MSWIYLQFTLIALVLANGLQNHDGQAVFETPSVHKERIAIIGAGAGGTSAAYHLQKYTNSSIFDITIFEKSDYIGGRSTTVHVHGNESWPVELGASIFIDKNYILWQNAELFNLSIVDSDIGVVKPEDDGIENVPGYGVFNGTSFVYVEKSATSFFGRLKSYWHLIRRYGVGPPTRTNNLVKSGVSSFLKFYEPENFPFSNLTEAANNQSLLQITNQTGLEYLGDSLFAQEIVQAATRVNYASNIDDVHGLATLVSLAADGASKIENGNWRIFEEFALRSQADVRLNSLITHIEPTVKGQWTVSSVQGTKKSSSLDVFDQVIVAAPWFQAFPGDLSGIAEPELVEYRTLYVTILTSTRRLNPRFFNVARHEYVPNMVLSTPEASELSVPFFSISIIRYLKERQEYVFKIFSPTELSDLQLNLLFPGSAEVTWVLRKTWNPYPYLRPLTEFGSWQVEPGLWYLNGVEQFISTMETSALAGANVAGLISLGRNTTEIIAKI